MRGAAGEQGCVEGATGHRWLECWVGGCMADGWLGWDTHNVGAAPAPCSAPSPCRRCSARLLRLPGRHGELVAKGQGGRHPGGARLPVSVCVRACCANAVLCQCLDCPAPPSGQPTLPSSPLLPPLSQYCGRGQGHQQRRGLGSVPERHAQRGRGQGRRARLCGGAGADGGCDVLRDGAAPQSVGHLAHQEARLLAADQRCAGGSVDRRALV